MNATQNLTSYFTIPHEGISDAQIINNFCTLTSSEMVFVITLLIASYILIEALFFLNELLKIKLLEQAYQGMKKAYYNLLFVPYAILSSYIIADKYLIKEHFISIMKYILLFMFCIIIIVLHAKGRLQWMMRLFKKK